MLDSLAKEVGKQTPSHVIFTGDEPAHDLWMQSKERNLAAVVNVSATVAKAAQAVGARFWPALGNHAAAPVDQFGGPAKDFWLYGPVADAWAGMGLLSPSAQVSVKWGGYYTQPIEPGLHIISLQTNFYDSQNLYLGVADHWDMAGQLHWLRDVLAQIAALGEKAIIIAHEKPGSFKNGIWGDDITHTISRYAHVIAGLYFGHNHNDMFHVVTATADSPVAKTGQPCQVVYVPSSLTPVERSTNPSYRLYYLDAHSKQVIDFDQYRFDLAKANQQGFISWERAYVASGHYNLKDLSPQSWLDAARRIATNDTLYQNLRSAYHGGLVDEHGDVVDKSAKTASCFVASNLEAEFKACMAKAGLPQLAEPHVFAKRC